MTVLRSWGPLAWMDARLGERTWSLLGVCGTEERCTSTLLTLPSDRLAAKRFLRIEDPQPADASAYAVILNGMEQTLRQLGGEDVDIPVCPLLEDIDTMREQVRDFVSTAGVNVVLDISCMPKWWFFPAVRFLLEDDGVENLLICYGSGATYGRHLASNTLPLEGLPTFEPRDDRSGHQELIVGIGFAPLELAELYSEQLERVRYLFPFPPGPPHFERNWRFLQDLEERIGHERRHADDRWHVSMYDCPSIFEALARFTDDGRRTCAMAPFGPKTVSLAMCLFSLACEKVGRPGVPAFYTQPQRYALDYTSGIRMFDGVPDVRAYAVRLGGRDLYLLDH